MVVAILLTSAIPCQARDRSDDRRCKPAVCARVPCEPRVAAAISTLQAWIVGSEVLQAIMRVEHMDRDALCRRDVVLNFRKRIVVPRLERVVPIGQPQGEVEISAAR